MVNEEFFNNVIERKTECLSYEDLEVIRNNPNVFKMKASFAKLMDKIDVVEWESSTAESNRTKREILGLLELDFPDAAQILGRLDSSAIKDPGYEIDLRSDLMKELGSLSKLKLCHFVDRCFYLAEKGGLMFFGTKHNADVCAHEFNKIVSEAYGLDLAFEIFGKAKTYRRFLKLDISRFDDKKIIKTVGRQCKHHLIILVEMAKMIRGMSDKELSKTKGFTQKLNNRTSKYIKLIIKERELTKESKTVQKGTFVLDSLGRKGRAL